MPETRLCRRGSSLKRLHLCCVSLGSIGLLPLGRQRRLAKLLSQSRRRRAVLLGSGRHAFLMPA